MASSIQANGIEQSSLLLKLSNEVLQMILAAQFQRIDFDEYAYLETGIKYILQSERTCRRLREQSIAVRNSTAHNRSVHIYPVESLPIEASQLCRQPKLAWLRNSMTLFELNCWSDTYPIWIKLSTMRYFCPKLKVVQFRAEIKECINQDKLELYTKQDLTYDKQALVQDAITEDWYSESGAESLKSKLHDVVASDTDFHNSKKPTLKVKGVLKTVFIDTILQSELLTVTTVYEHQKFNPEHDEYLKSGTITKSKKCQSGDMEEVVRYRE